MKYKMFYLKLANYILNHLIMIVNKGIGYNIIPFRINCRPEVIQIIINNKSNINWITKDLFH